VKFSDETAASAWLSLLPYMESDELRELLDEAGASRLAGRLDAEGLPLSLGPPSWPAAAAVLAELRGHPDHVIEGVPVG
jgi:hypothetical protein